MESFLESIEFSDVRLADDSTDVAKTGVSNTNEAATNVAIIKKADFCISFSY